MKKILLVVVLALTTMLLQAQEVMKVELKKGEIIEYKVDDVKRVYFDTVNPNDDNDDIKTDYLIMFVGDKEEIVGTVKTATSQNEFVASVKGSTVTANHTGATFILVNEKHPIVIMVFSLKTSIPDPVLKWGEPKDTIKAHHTKGTIDKDDATTLSYKNCGYASIIGYSFDEEGKLSGALVQVPSSRGTYFLSYLTERYLIYPEEQSDGYYLGFDGYDKEHIKTVIMYSPKQNVCVYLPYSKFNDKNTNAREGLSRLIKDVGLKEE